MDEFCVPRAGKLPIAPFKNFTLTSKVLSSRGRKPILFYHVSEYFRLPFMYLCTNMTPFTIMRSFWDSCFKFGMFTYTDLDRGSSFVCRIKTFLP